jgi:7-cyano-7-deazaguanine synthase
MSAAVVLLSGGQDSTTCLGWAVKKFDTVHTLSIAYGQRHATEIQVAREIAQKFGVPWRAVNVPTFAAFSDSDLVKSDTEIKGSGGYADAAAPDGLPTSFVPGRNLLFLTIAAALAVKVGAKAIVTGVCQTDYSGYPDCRASFIAAMQMVINEAMPSESGPFEIFTPLMHLNKKQTVELAHADELTWEALALSITCYNGHRPGCGTCPACELRAKGFAEAGLEDPAAASSKIA